MDGSGSEGRGLWPRSMGFSRPHGFNTSGQEGSVPGYPPAAGSIRMCQFWAQVMGLRCHPICGDTGQLDTLNLTIYSPMESTVFGVCVQAWDSGTFYLQEKLKFYYLLCLWGMPTKVRVQIRVTSLLSPLCGLQGWSTGCQACAANTFTH